MGDMNEEPQLDLEGFSLAEEGPVRIAMPPAPVYTDDDVDAQLFGYVAQAQKGSGIHFIADLDDKWVQGHFPDLTSMEDLRAAVVSDLERERACNLRDLKYRRCADALVVRLVGDVPDAVFDFCAKAARAQYTERLAAAGMSKQNHMQQEGMSESEFEGKLREGALFNVKLNAVLDIMALRVGETVADEELTEYLTVPDPDTFLDEAKEGGKLEQARQAAVRVKVMRAVMDEAVVDEKRS